MFKFFVVLWCVYSGGPVKLEVTEVPDVEACSAGVSEGLKAGPIFLAAHPELTQFQAVCEVWPVKGKDA
jgi:hypothetical protein